VRRNRHRLDLYALTQQATTPEKWQSAMNQEIASADRTNFETARKAHQQWWTKILGPKLDSCHWKRPKPKKASQSYAIQRYLTACAGRGAQPIKFNGSLFTVGHDLPEGASSTEDSHDPD